MGKTLNRIIQGIVLGTSLLLSVGCNGKTANSSGIEKIIAPKQEILLYEELPQEQDEYLKTKYGNEGGVLELYNKVGDKGCALYGIGNETDLEYFYNIEPYTGNIKTETGKTYSLYVVLPDKNNKKVLVRLNNKIIESKSEVVDKYEDYEALGISSFKDKNMTSGIFCMKENGQFNGDYGFRVIYVDGKDTELDTNIFPAKIVKFPDSTKFATIDWVTGKIIDEDSNILGDVDPKLLEIFRTCYE